MNDRQREEGRSAAGSRGRRPARSSGWIALAGSLLVLAGCSPESSMSQQDLSLACEMRKCDCAPDSSTFDPGIPVQWQLDGSAYCKKGYHLRILDLPPSSKMVT